MRDGTLLITVHEDAERLERGKCLRLQYLAVPLSLVVFSHCQGGRGSQTRNQRDWQCTRTQPAFLTSAVRERFERHPRIPPPSANQRTDALWRVDLVSRDAQKIDSCVAQRGDQLAECLCSIDMQIGVVVR